MRLFGTSGIRGVVGADVTAELAARLGACLVRGNGWRVVIGRDSRTTGPMLEDALASGVISAGGIARRIGIAPTPTTALAAKNWGDCGVMVTASHNPPEYNGFKLFDGNGREAGREEEERIEREVGSPAKPDWRAMGREERVETAIREHVSLALSLVDTRLISEKAPKVLLDCGNGAGSLATPYALRMAGCRVVTVNSEPSGFFSRGLEPNLENLKETGAMVKACGADLGLAHDGDADRTVVMDEEGALLGLDVQLAIMTAEILRRKKGTVVSTIEAGLTVKEAAEGAGGALCVTKVGSVHVSREMARTGAVFGGEPCGEYIYHGGVPVPDGVLSALKFVELYCARGSLKVAASGIGPGFVRRAKFPAKDREASMKRIAPEILKAFPGRAFSEDGIRVDFDGGWVLVRASGTEPIIRLTAEADSAARLESVFDKAEAIVKALA
jgi:phosphoglucosamine mutase